MKAMINIQVPEEAISKVGKVVLEILNNKSKNDQSTLQQALETLRSITKIEKISIDHCSCDMK